MNLLQSWQQQNETVLFIDCICKKFTCDNVIFLLLRIKNQILQFSVKAYLNIIRHFCWVRTKQFGTKRGVFAAIYFCKRTSDICSCDWASFSWNHALKGVSDMGRMISQFLFRLLYEHYINWKILYCVFLRFSTSQDWA